MIMTSPTKMATRPTMRTYLSADSGGKVDEAAHSPVLGGRSRSARDLTSSLVASMM